MENSSIKIVEFSLLDIDTINAFQKEFENLKNKESLFDSKVSDKS